MPGVARASWPGSPESLDSEMSAMPDGMPGADPIADIAFPAMELALQGHKELASALTESHLDAGRRWGIPECLLRWQASPDVVRGRLQGRLGDLSDADWTVHAEIARHWQELGPRTRVMTREVDTGGTQTEAIRTALESLRDFGLAGGRARDSRRSARARIWASQAASLERSPVRSSTEIATVSAHRIASSDFPSAPSTSCTSLVGA
jgi:hypothetical protein